MLDLCKLVFSHAEIMQMSKEIIVLKDILNEFLHLKTWRYKFSWLKKWDLIAEI